MTQDFISGERETNIKNNFLNKLTELNLTYDQFISNGKAILSGYAFSPDHTSVKESINEHKNANLLQFFIGGSINYYVLAEHYGWIKVIVENNTSRNSLLLHQASNYERSETTNNKPLSTIKQRLIFLIKIN